ncbi:MAG: bifunctional pyr operon transcriptional regulator/uracil phosphoribosyltransferase PyrR [Clostridiales bacterium]|nr:bifunctional pyr operon transcriptional regulator/uracil phosphoribosyltransferase PyrR [Clostridiales bacterium]
MTRKTQILDGAGITRALARITHEIIERNEGVKDICLLGVKSRGIPLAKILQSNIEKFENVKVPLGHLDITLHRDDMTETDKQATGGECHIPCDIREKTVIIVDDVLFTGRTARAALESVFTHDRPKAVQLAVLIDRGHRELPIRPDYVGKNMPTSKTERVEVKVDDIDGESGVYICNGD